MKKEKTISIDQIKIHTLQDKGCYYILKDGRVVYSGEVYPSVKALALHFMEKNISLDKVQKLEEIVSLK